MINRTVAMILAGGQGERLSVLSRQRAKPAVPFGGKYRIIDFALSNCVNSGIYDVAVLTQYRPHSLNQHIGAGRPWDLDRNTGGVRLLQPYLGHARSDWYRGTADAFYHNLWYVEEQKADLILILSGDHIYRQDYREMIAFHQAKRADVTVAVTEVPLERGQPLRPHGGRSRRSHHPLLREAEGADQHARLDGHLYLQPPRAGRQPARGVRQARAARLRPVGHPLADQR